MFNLGLKIGSKDTQYTDDILRYYDEGVFQYIELFAIPGTYNDTISYWKQFNIPFGIHAPHSMAGLNLSNSFMRNENTRKIIESYKFADELKADKAEYTRKFKSSFEFLFLGWLFALQKSVVIQIQLELPVHLLRFLKEKLHCWCCKEQCIVRL